MATKKFYAVKKGKSTGVFNSWDECKLAVDGYPNAEYKGFTSLSEAEAYLDILQNSEDKQSDLFHTSADKLVAYVDGSYDDSVKRYAFGCVFLLPDGEIYTEFGNGENEKSLQHRNVTGEMLGAMYAVKTAIMNGYKTIELYFDYQGIEKWVTGEWKSKTELTQKYTISMRQWTKDIKIEFHKVAAHTNVKYNELADKMAKRGILEGEGVPKVRKITELRPYQE